MKKNHKKQTIGHSQEESETESNNAAEPPASLMQPVVETIFDNPPRRFDDTDPESDDVSMSETVSDEESTEPKPVQTFQGDWPLANSIMLMRNRILFLEVCQAIATGDAGRVWEVLKVSYLTNFTRYRLTCVA
jgi:hypothetical protein